MSQHNTIAESQLSAELSAFLAAHPQFDQSEFGGADELLLAYGDSMTDWQRLWAKEFCNRWEFLTEGEFYYIGVYVPANHPDHAAWIATPEYAAFIAEWGQIYVPAGFAEHDPFTDYDPFGDN